MTASLITALKRRSHLLSAARAHSQRGVATILVILMVGVGLVTVSLGTLHTVRSAQERQLVAHAQVNSQAGVWAAVDVVRQYLQTLSAAQLNVLDINQPWTITGTEGLAQTVTITGVITPVAPSMPYRINAQVQATAEAARSSSVLEVVYEVTPGTAPDHFELNGILDFYNDLNVGGGITLNVPGGANFNVDGDFRAESASVSGIGLGRLGVTGDIVIGSAIDAAEVWGRNITLTGSASVKQAYAFGTPVDEGGTVAGGAITAKAATCCGNFSMTGGTSAEGAHANGNVVLNGGGVPLVEARGNVEVKSGGVTHGTIKVSKNAVVTNGNGATSLEAGGNISLSGSFTAPGITATGNITCGNAWWPTYPSLRAGGTITSCNNGGLSNNHPGLNPAPVIIPMDKLPPVQLSRPTVNAWPLRASANYAFEFIGGHLMVTVKNVNGIVDDTYYVKGNSNNPREYLCKAVVNNVCSQPVAPFCNGYSANNACFSVATTSGISTLTIAGNSMPPGVVWFKGSLHLSNGIYYNTFVATHNISTGGRFVSYALNYAAAYKTNPTDSVRKNAVCKNEFDISVKTNDFATLYPTNYCDSAGTYTPNALGNIGMLAGGYDPATNPTSNTVYSGGYINLGASNSIYGTVVAGNLLNTGGSTTIYGYISAAGLQMSDADNNLGGSTTVDVTNLPDGYTPNEIPDMSGGTPGVTAEAKVLWTRYL
ncbi:hypothetical protein [Cellvibrio sp. NN19]|uniref:hypothetical protein n=1 Tax=Cellvibrio chitinivorans TaxID=3102792 RepID=UPI002B405CB7|nr:hypothetical protein [Cellvibrio sp. NN19]